MAKKQNAFDVSGFNLSASPSLAQTGVEEGRKFVDKGKVTQAVA